MISLVQYFISLITHLMTSERQNVCTDLEKRNCHQPWATLDQVAERARVNPRLWHPTHAFRSRHLSATEAHAANLPFLSFHPPPRGRGCHHCYCWYCCCCRAFPDTYFTPLYISIKDAEGLVKGKKLYMHVHIHTHNCMQIYVCMCVCVCKDCHWGR